MSKLYISGLNHSVKNDDIYDYFRCLNIPLKSFYRLNNQSGFLNFEEGLVKKETILSVSDTYIKDTKILISEVAHCSNCNRDGHYSRDCRNRRSISPRRTPYYRQDLNPSPRRRLSPPRRVRRSQSPRYQSPRRFSPPPRNTERYSETASSYGRYCQDFLQKFKINQNINTGEIQFDCKNNIYSLIELENWYNSILPFLSYHIDKKIHPVSFKGLSSFNLNNVLISAYSICYVVYLKIQD